MLYEGKQTTTIWERCGFGTFAWHTPFHVISMLCVTIQNQEELHSLLAKYENGHEDLYFTSHPLEVYLFWILTLSIGISYWGSGGQQLTESHTQCKSVDFRASFMSLLLANYGKFKGKRIPPIFEIIPIRECRRRRGNLDKTYFKPVKRSPSTYRCACQMGYWRHRYWVQNQLLAT